MRPKISYITCATSYHEQTGIIITFAQFEEGNIVENERNAEEDKSILDFIDESSTYDDSDLRCNNKTSKLYLIYVTITQKKLSSYVVVFDKHFLVN